MPTTPQFLDNFSNNVKSNVDLASVRLWAGELLRQDPTERELQSKDVPEALHRLESGTAFGFVARSKDDGSMIVFVEWGGGFQHWGLAFTTNESLLKQYRMVTKQLTNGVYSFVTVDNPDP